MPYRFVTRIPLVLLFPITFSLLTVRSFAQTPAEIRQAFVDLHDDKVPHNCDHATDWLLKYCDQLKTELNDELYKTDWQGRNAICTILFKTPSFEPDDRFIRQSFLLLRDDEIPHNAEEASAWLAKRADKITPLLLDELYKTDAQGREQVAHILYQAQSFVPDERFIQFIVAKWVDSNTDEGDWKYIHDRFETFEPLLETAILKSRNQHHDMYLLWATTWVMRKRGEVERYAKFFSPSIMSAAATHLRSDTESSNAGWAVRFFLLLGDRSIDTLREVTRSKDSQARSLAQATIDALGGSRKAFGYLQARVELTKTPFGPTVSDPDWLAGVTAPYRDNEKPYEGR